MHPGRSMPLPSGEKIAALGQGSWHFAESPARWAEEVASIRLGIDLGMMVIDTAEMYGDGAAETLVGEAIAGRRSEVFLVDKVLPHHATRAGTVRACEASLGRLGVDYIDLYLLHWRGRIPLVETIEGFAQLEAGRDDPPLGCEQFRHRRHDRTVGVPGGDEVQANQILYNLTRRGPEFALIAVVAQYGIPTMAYSPIEQGRLVDHPALKWLRGRERHSGTGRAGVGASTTTASTLYHAPEHLPTFGKTQPPEISS